MPRIVGVETPTLDLNLSRPQAPDLFPVASQMTSNALNQSSQMIAQGLQQQSRITQEIAQGSAQASAATADAKVASARASATDGGLGGFLTDAAKATKTIVDTIGAIDKASSDAQFANATAELYKLQDGMEEVIRLDPGGFAATETAFNTILERYPSINSQGRAELYKSFYGNSQRIREELTKKTLDERGKLEDAKIEEYKVRLSINMADTVAKLAVTTNDDEQYKLSQGLVNIVANAISNPKLPDKAKQAIINQGLTTIATASFKSEEQQSAIMSRMQNMADFSKLASEAEIKYRADGDYATYAATLVAAGYRYGMPKEVTEKFDVEWIREQINKNTENRQNTVKLAQAGSVLAQDAVEYTSLEVGASAAELIADPGRLAQFRNSPHSKSGEGARIIGVIDQALKLDTRVREISTLKAQAQVAKAKIQKGDLEDLLRSMISFNNQADGKQQTNLLMSLPSMQGLFSTELQEALKSKTPEQAIAKIPPEKLAEVRALLGQQSLAIMRALDGEVAAKDQELDLLRAGLAAYGLDKGIQGFPYDKYKALKEQIRQKQEAAAAAGAALTGAPPPGTPPNFKGAPAYIGSAGKANTQGLKFYVPIPATARPEYVEYTSGFGPRSSPGGVGSTNHMGMDIAMPTGTPLISPTNGKVEVDAYNDGAGYSVYIVGDDGIKHRFLHMDKPPSVKHGQRVQAGQPVGVVGSTGASTGPHLHWEIYDKNNQIINPYPWAVNAAKQQGQRQPPVQPKGPQNQQPQVLPPGAFKLNGGYLKDGVFYNMTTPGSAPTKLSNQPQRPVVGTNNSIYKKDYAKKNSASANYGYAVLAQDKAFAAKVADVANRLDIPAQWLVDVMAYESGGQFKPNQWNYGGAPAVGLIQFYEDADGSRIKNIGGVNYHLDQIAAMSRVQQMELVYQYLKPVRGDLKTAYHVLSAVFVGPGSVTRLDNNGNGLEGMSDSDISFGKYKQRLGNGAGRRYGSSSTAAPATTQSVGKGATTGAVRDLRQRVGIDKLGKQSTRPTIDTKFATGCTFCANLQASNSSFITHERQDLGLPNIGGLADAVIWGSNA